MKDALCKAFCDSIELRKVPSGYAVTTPFLLADGDPILFYVIEKSGAFQIEDDGTQVAAIEASGVDLRSGARSEAFQALQSEYGLTFDEDTRVLRTGLMQKDELPCAALRTIAALLRLQDLALLHPRIVKSTFRDDATAAIHQKFAERAQVAESAPVTDQLGNYMADLVLTTERVPPLAIYLGTSDEKALQALVLKMETEKYREIPCRVILLLGRSIDVPLREPTYALAQARLDHVLSFRGVEADAMNVIDRVLFNAGGAA